MERVCVGLTSWVDSEEEESPASPAVGLAGFCAVSSCFIASSESIRGSKVDRRARKPSDAELQ